MPGGAVDPGESPHAAARREVIEELGVALPVGRLLVVDHLPARGDTGASVRYVPHGQARADRAGTGVGQKVGKMMMRQAIADYFDRLNREISMREAADTAVLAMLANNPDTPITIFGKRVRLEWPDGRPFGKTEDELRQMAREWLLHRKTEPVEEPKPPAES